MEPQVSLDARLRELELFSFQRPPEPDEDLTGRLAYKAMCDKLDRQENGFYRFPITSVLDKLDKPDINLSRCGIGDQGAQALAETIKINTTISSLNLTDNHLTPVGAEHLINALMVNKSIRSVNFADNRLGNQALVGTSGMSIGALVRQLLNKNATVTDICLRGNSISDRDMEMISEGVIDNVTLTKIDLSYNDIGPRGAIAIAELLAHGSTDLRELRIEWNRFQRIGALAILRDGLQHTGTVRKFHMAWAGIGDEGGEALGDIIRGSSVLEEVDVSHNRIGPKGAESIARGIRESTTLVRIFLNGNPIPDSGCASVVRALKDNKSVQMCGLRDTGAGPLTEAEIKDLVPTKSSEFGLDVKTSRFEEDMGKPNRGR
jgi:hypothetical protein